MGRCTRPAVRLGIFGPFLAALLCLTGAGRAGASELIAAHAYMDGLSKPKFAASHTLPPLTRYGWGPVPYALRVELADNWGYALEMGNYWEHKHADRLESSLSDEARLAKLAASDPEKYKLSVITNRGFPENPPPGTWTRDGAGRLLTAKAQSLDGTEWHPGMKAVVSLEAPDEFWRQLGRLRAEPIARLREKAPITIVLNGGEYGLGAFGAVGNAWAKDPRILTAKGGRSWFEYYSKRAAHAQGLVTEEIRKAVPDLDLYIYYTTSGIGHQNRYRGWWRWAAAVEDMVSVADLPSSEHYYRHFNSGFLGDKDMLSLALNAKAHEIAAGHRLSYNWFWGKQSDTERFMGFVKCLYVMGMLGANVGWYGGNHDYRAIFRNDDPPYWLRQLEAVGRVHALFSHLEEDIRGGRPVEGPYRHFWSTDLPAYELTVEVAGKPPETRERSGHSVLPMGREVRAVARKREGRERWLIAAWAAGGPARDVMVTVPGYGEVELQARPGGSVYVLDADAQPRLALMDADPLFPTKGM